MEKSLITVARGDGIGPEIMDGVLAILEAAEARLEIEQIDIGEKWYLQGYSTGIPEEAWDSIHRSKVLLKAPITTPSGGGYKSLNVTFRIALGLYANVRPCRSFHPVVPSKSPRMNLVIVRENEEDLYAGIEYQQSPEVVQALKFITRPGCEKVIRYAFEYCRATARKKLTSMTKDNILKMTDGLFHKIFEEVGAEYPDIEKDHWIIDIGMARLADAPENFETIVLPNLYGDIASDVVAQVAGSVGLAGSANVGDDYAMFEAIHGSAPKHAGLNKANPSGLLQAAVMMLLHLGQNDVAERVENAWLKTLEDKIFTYDLARNSLDFGHQDFREVGTREFTQGIVERMGQRPDRLKPASYANSGARLKTPTVKNVRGAHMSLRGVDVYLNEPYLTPTDLARSLEDLAGDDFKLVLISNRGQKVYPSEVVNTYLTDHYRCRFEAEGETRHDRLRDLLSRIEGASLHWIKLENLYYINGQRGYTLGQGQ